MIEKKRFKTEKKEEMVKSIINYDKRCYDGSNESIIYEKLE